LTVAKLTEAQALVDASIEGFWARAARGKIW
jgi:hypothetical protein